MMVKRFITTAAETGEKERYIAPPRETRRWKQVLNLATFIASAVVIVIVINFFAQRDSLRSRFDATKTRAYSLSEQTQKLLASLQGKWTIALVMSDRTMDRPLRLQIDEVIRRFTEASPNISVRQVNPVNPMEYDPLLAQLREVYKESLTAYDEALDDGTQAFEALQVFAQQQSPILESAASRMPADDPDRNSLQQRVGLLGLLADQGGQVIELVRKARRIDAARPIPDYETARSVLAQSLTQWAGELDEIANVFSRWQERPNFDATVRQFAAVAQKEYRTMSQQLAEASDPLKRLPPMELGDIGVQLGQGEAAVVVGPDRAAVIPSAQLFPLKQKDGVSFVHDQRFRGEQLIAAALRSLTVQRMPLVVFVHAEADSLFRRKDPRKADLIGQAQMLRVTKFEVDEWNATKPTTRPTPARGQPVVWVVVPPPPARALEASAAVHALAESVSQLIATGESVLLSVSPSLVAKYGQPDPFETIAAPFGLRADTATLVLESNKVAAGERQTTLEQVMSDFGGEHLISRAIDGQQARFGLPNPIETASAVPTGVKQFVIASIKPSPDRWREKNWVGELSELELKDDERLKQPVPIVVAVERTDASGRARQRFMLVGSGGWMLSNVADVGIELGNGRIALINPGNYELMQASVAWLAGMDDLIAAGPLSQEVPRLRDITPEARSLWRWIIIAGVPGACIALGMIMWFVRRN